MEKKNKLKQIEEKYGKDTGVPKLLIEMMEQDEALGLYDNYKVDKDNKIITVDHASWDTIAPLLKKNYPDYSIQMGLF